MEPEVRERFERIEAILARTAEGHRRSAAENEKRHKAAMERMDRFDRRLETTRKLVTSGIGMVTPLAAEARARAPILPHSRPSCEPSSKPSPTATAAPTEKLTASGSCTPY